jgi:hypothetical protein
MPASIISRVAVVAVIVAFLVVIGCVTPAVKPGHVPLEQTGQVKLASEAETEIRFQTPYSQPPEILLEDDSLSEVKVIECFPDRFRIRNNSYQVQEVSWKATGERQPPAESTK